MAFSTVTRPHALVWQLTISQPPDNRLTPPVLHELMRRFDQIEADWRRTNAGKAPKDWQGGALVITGGGPKFFSNGLDPETTKSPDFTTGLFEPFKNRLLTFPLVTVAAVNGHCFAGGFLLALCCDIRIMTGGRGLLSLNENAIGIPLAPSGTELITMKLAPNYLTPVALGARFNQKQALAAGILHEIVDVSRGPNGLLERAVEIGVSEAPKTSWGVWGAIKEGLYRTVIAASQLPRAPRSLELDELFWARIARQELEREIKAKM